MGPSWPPEGPTYMSYGEGRVAGKRAQVVVVVILKGGGGGRRGAWRERKQPWLLCGGVWPLPLCQFDQIKRGGKGGAKCKWVPLKS